MISADTDTAPITASNGKPLPRDQKSCPECNGQIITAGYEIFCEECGLIIDEETIDPGPEWRSFSHEEYEDKARTGAPNTKLRHDRGIGTTIGTRTDGHGNELSADRRRRLRRLRTWDNRIKTNNDRRLIEGIIDIKRMGSATELPKSIIERAAMLYRQAQDNGLLVGHSVEAFTTAAVYIAARDQGYPREMSKLVAVSRVHRDAIWTAIHRYQTGLNVKTIAANPEDYLTDFLNDLATNRDDTLDSDALFRKAIELINHGREENFHVGRKPTGVAATAIYTSSLLTGVKVTQAELSDIANVSPPTIRKGYRKLASITGHDELLAD